MDAELFRAIDRLGWATYAHLEAVVGRSQGALRRRLPRLERLGMVKSATTDRDLATKAWRLAAEGRQFVGSRLPRVDGRPSLLQLEEASVVSGLKLPGHEVVTRRELQTLFDWVPDPVDGQRAVLPEDPLDAHVAARLGLNLDVFGSYPRFHVPAAALVAEGFRDLCEEVPVSGRDDSFELDPRQALLWRPIAVEIDCRTVDRRRLVAAYEESNYWELRLYASAGQPVRPVQELIQSTEERGRITLQVFWLSDPFTRLDRPGDGPALRGNAIGVFGG